MNLKVSTAKVLCTIPGCERVARHWARIDDRRPNKRRPICHACFKTPDLGATKLHMILSSPLPA